MLETLEIQFKWYLISTTGLKINIPHHITPLSPLIHGRMNQYFHVVYTKFWIYLLNVTWDIETDQTRQCFSSRLFWACPNCSLSFLLLADRSGPLCVFSAAVPICFNIVMCIQRCSFFYTLLVTSGYLSYCCLPIGSKQSGHCPLTSTGLFFTGELMLTGYFLSFNPFSVNPRDGCMGKSQ